MTSIKDIISHFWIESKISMTVSMQNLVCKAYNFRDERSITGPQPPDTVSARNSICRILVPFLT